MDKTVKTIESYNRCVRDFVEKYMDLGKYKRFVEEFSDRLKTGAKILDLGCGPGNVAKLLMDQHREYQIWGVDLSMEMIKLAQRNVPSGHFILQDIRFLEPARTFDAIIASFCLIHLDDDETNRLVKKTFTWLNENGCIYISFMTGGKPGFEKPNFSDGEIYFNYYFPERMSQMLEEAGYQIVSRQNQDYLRKDGKKISDVFIIARK
jgi:cyclopropane fatty-acyl-phospholipid synthase-like methyltransferase